MSRSEDQRPDPESLDSQLTRRELLRVLGAGTVGAGLGLGVPQWVGAHAPTRADDAIAPRRGPVRPVLPLVTPFDLRQVELLESEFTAARERDAAYMLYLDADRLLHNFRENAGLEPKAPVYGGWESQEPWVDIRCHGHTLGHWLTAGALMYASTRDRRFRERIDYIVDELRACQDAAGTGLVCAFPDGAEQLLRAVQGQRFTGVPWYTMHKVFAGLRDAHTLGGNQAALEVLVRLTEWAVDATDHMSHEQFQRMLDREHGGMNEVLADVYALTRDPRHLALAERFNHEALLVPLARGEDVLNGLHANTQIPKVVGFLRLYALTGRPEYLAAAQFFWRTVVENRSFVTGGHGDIEHFFPPETFPRHLHSAKTMETCCSHNMLRLTRMLFGVEPLARYADYYERTLYNTILASQDPETGYNTYFQPTLPGYLKLYHTPIDSFWCCTGSGLENHAKYNDSIYFGGPDELFVNLFIPSELRWEDKGLRVRQTTRFPDDDTTRLEITGPATRATISIRYPAWAEGATFTVNGRPVGESARPGSYVAIEREWRTGDVVEARLPMRLRTEALPGERSRVALVYGPIVLAGRLGTEGLYPGADILRNERTYGMILQVPVEVPELATDARALPGQVRRVEGEPLAFETVGIGRPRDVTLVPYHRLHHERYTLYWRLI